MKKLNTALLVLAVALLLIANMGYWLSSTIYNPTNFSNTVVQAYESPEVRNAIASEIVDSALGSRPLVKQVLGDPIHSAISGIIGSNMFKTVLKNTASKFNTYVTSSNRKDVTVEVGQVSRFVKVAATAISPSLGDQVPSTTPQTIVIVKSSSIPNVNQWLRPIMFIGPIAGFFSIVIVLVQFYRSKYKPGYIKKASIYFLIGLFVFALLIPYFRTVLQGSISNQNAETIATSTYNAFASIMLGQLAVLAWFFVATLVIGLVWIYADKNHLVDKLKNRYIQKSKSIKEAKKAKQANNKGAKRNGKK